MARGHVALRDPDLPAEFVDDCLALGVAAVDIETTGLLASDASIRTVQVRAGERTFIIEPERSGDRPPPEVARLLGDQRCQKVFHHAPFDLGFLRARWGIETANVFCTKATERVLNPGLPNNEYSLQEVLRRYFGVVIDKSLQESDWSRAELTKEQINYASMDVAYLVELRARMLERGVDSGLSGLIARVNEFIPAFVELRYRGVQRLYEH